MLGYTDYHTPEGITTINESAAEGIYNWLSDGSEFAMCRDVSVPEYDVIATVGFARYGKPDIVIGTFISDDVISEWEEFISNLQAYMANYGVPDSNTPINPVELLNFFAEEGDSPIYSLDDISPKSRIPRLVRIDTERWFAGNGWQQAAYYTAEERANAIILQWVISDDEGRFPDDEGYNGPAQYLFDTRPFGHKAPSAEISAVQKARNTLMH